MGVVDKDDLVDEWFGEIQLAFCVEDTNVNAD